MKNPITLICVLVMFYICFASYLYIYKTTHKEQANTFTTYEIDGKWIIEKTWGHRIFQKDNLYFGVTDDYPVAYIVETKHYRIADKYADNLIEPMYYNCGIDTTIRTIYGFKLKETKDGTWVSINELQEFRDTIIGELIFKELVK